jgi:hypothetical protein
MERICRHLSYANVAATLALVFAMSGGAIAATGGFTSNGKLQACVNGEGTLKLLTAGKHCRKGQKTVAWNQTGPSGAPGAPGASGPTGAAGGAGSHGAAGANGTDGFNANEFIVVRTRIVKFGGNGGFEEDIKCEEGEHAISGGVSETDGSAGSDVLEQSAPINDSGEIVKEGDEPTGWALGYKNNNGATNVTIEVTCAS